MVIVMDILLIRLNNLSQYHIRGFYVRSRIVGVVHFLIHTKQKFLFSNFAIGPLIALYSGKQLQVHVQLGFGFEL